MLNSTPFIVVIWLNYYLYVTDLSQSESASKDLMLNVSAIEITLAGSNNDLKFN